VRHGFIERSSAEPVTVAGTFGGEGELAVDDRRQPDRPRRYGDELFRMRRAVTNEKFEWQCNSA